VALQIPEAPDVTGRQMGKYGLSPLANYTEPSDRRLSAKLVPSFADRRCHVVSVTDPHGRILASLYLESMPVISLIASSNFSVSEGIGMQSDAHRHAGR
jgi:hypothetical protein